MKNLISIFTLAFLSIFTLQAQEFSAGASLIAYHADNIKTPVAEMSFIPSVDLRYKYEINDGHHLLVYSEFSAQTFETREGDTKIDGVNLRAGFNMFINAIPFDDLFDMDKSTELRMLFGMGFEYDSYWQTGDFVPSIKLHVKHRRLLFEFGAQAHLLQSFYYELVPELRAGLYYDIFVFDK